MCGIIAVFGSTITKELLSDIRKGYEMLENRGPDTESFQVMSEEVWGFKRLSIVDSEGGLQPFSMGSKRLVCNGEIFNHKSLRAKYELKCTCNSDCAVILPLFERLGDVQTVLEELSGDFAFILRTPDQIYFARDPIGVRPLFLGKLEGGGIALASYARALQGFCSSVEEVVPGWGVYDIQKKKLDFCGVQERSVLPLYSLDNPEQKVHDLLVRSVKARLMSDRPIGCLLSGGLDSSLITSILCKLLGPQQVRTYSIGMEGSPDLFHARLVAERLGTHHTEFRFTAQEGFEAVPCVIRDLESYDITTVRASVGMWLLAKKISESTDDVVLFSGEGADELFMGYLYFHHAPTALDAQEESYRLVQNLYKYDIVRADRCVSSHGLELRVPFLDKALVDYCLQLPGTFRYPQQGMEKALLRDAFDREDYLPPSVLWRRKDGMSDGIGGNKGKTWYQELQEHIEPLVTENELTESGLPSKEALYYKKLHDSMFGSHVCLEREYWMPKWVETAGDPSGRKIPEFLDV
jgi:asparagine synthase (glutamine-hydrolysing)